MDYKIRPTNNATKNSDIKGVVDVLNYYVDDIEDTCAEYWEEKIEFNTVNEWIKLAEQNQYPFYIVEAFIDNDHKKIIGFGFLLPYGGINAITLTRSSDITIFLDHRYRNQGIGSKILEQLISNVKARGVDNIMASISSRNVKCIEFLKKYGFKECGKILRAGKKHDKDFDIIWMQFLI